MQSPDLTGGALLDDAYAGHGARAAALLADWKRGCAQGR
jgi:hypothetical protein